MPGFIWLESLTTDMLFDEFELCTPVILFATEPLKSLKLWLNDFAACRTVAVYE